MPCRRRVRRAACGTGRRVCCVYCTVADNRAPRAPVLHSRGGLPAEERCLVAKRRSVFFRAKEQAKSEEATVAHVTADRHTLRARTSSSERERGCYCPTRRSGEPCVLTKTAARRGYRRLCSGVTRATTRRPDVYQGRVNVPDVRHRHVNNPRVSAITTDYSLHAHC